MRLGQSLAADIILIISCERKAYEKRPARIFGMKNHGIGARKYYHPKFCPDVCMLCVFYGIRGYFLL